MGATAAVGAGLSVVGGLANVNSKKKQQKAEKEAIKSQQQMDQLNRELQLMSLNNQLAIDQRQSQLNQAVENEAYLNRQFQLSAQELSNQTALEDARIQAGVSYQQAGLQESAASTQAIQQETAQNAEIANSLASSIGASTQETEAALKGMQSLPERDRQKVISNLMNVMALEDGENLALNMLAELTQIGDQANIKRANEFGTLQIQQADALADSSKQATAIQRGLTGTQSSVQGTSQRYGSETSSLDVKTAKVTNAAASEAERISTDAAYEASLINRQLEDATRNTSYAAQTDLLKQGGVLSEKSYVAQTKAIGSTGFMDYLGVAAQGASTYNTLR